MERSVGAANSPLAGNLGREGQNARLRGSVLLLAVALVVAVVLVRLGVDRPWRLLTFIPFFMAAFGALQGLYRTCPFHSRQGTREAVGRAALPQNERCIAMSKRLAGRVLGASMLSAAAATTVVYLLPS